MILRFLIKAVGYVFGLIMRVWRGGRGSARLGRWKKGGAPHPLAELLIRDTPGASSKISLLFRHFPPSPSPSTMSRFPSAPLPAAPGHAEQTRQQNSPAHTRPPSSPFCCATDGKSQRLSSAVKFTLSSMSTETRFVSDGSFCSMKQD